MQYWPELLPALITLELIFLQVQMFWGLLLKFQNGI